MEKVGLPEADTPVDEQRVVGAAGILGHLHGSRSRKLIGFAFDEGLERERRSQSRALALAPGVRPAPGLHGGLLLGHGLRRLRGSTVAGELPAADLNDHARGVTVLQSRQHFRQTIE